MGQYPKFNSFSVGTLSEDIKTYFYYWSRNHWGKSEFYANSNGKHIHNRESIVKTQPKINSISITFFREQNFFNIFEEAEHNFLFKVLAKIGDYKHNWKNVRTLVIFLWWHPQPGFDIIVNQHSFSIFLLDLRKIIFSTN